MLHCLNRWSRVVAAPVATCCLAALCVLPRTTLAQRPPLPVFYEEIAPGVAAKVELSGAPGFREDVVFEIYFLSPASSLTADLLDPEGEPGMDFIEQNIDSVSEGDASAQLGVVKCRFVDGGEQCRAFERPPEFRVLPSGIGLEVLIPAQRIDWQNEFFRFEMAEGRLTLATLDENHNVSSTRPSPAIGRALLPSLVDRERAFLEQRPFLRVDFSPLVSEIGDLNAGLDNFLKELALTFEGGVYRPSASGTALWQLTWAGDISTAEALSFNRLLADAGASVNILRRDWLPLTLTARAESDQGLDAVDLSGMMRIAYVLPVNLHLQTGSYRPAVAPRLEVLGAFGRCVQRDLSLLEEEFVRVGYDLRWRIPVGASSNVRLHNAGIWNKVAGRVAEWHMLWDVMIEVRAAGLAYFIEYQEGEAAPLFQHIETSRLGLSIATAKLAVGNQ